MKDGKKNIDIVTLTDLEIHPFLKMIPSSHYQI